MTSTGLSSADAAARLARDGANAIPAVRGPSALRRVAKQFHDPLVRLLLLAIALDVGVWWHEGAEAWPVEAASIAAILLFNAALGVVQEMRSERALERLASVAAPWSWTLRDGALVRIPSRDLVAGDVVRLDEGDRVPADGHVLPGPGFLVDESLLTGESVPVPRAAGEDLDAGTLAVRGSGFVEVTRTGARSALGRLAGLMGTIEVSETPLEVRMRRFGHRVTWAVAVIAAVLVVIGVTLSGLESLVPTMIFAVALAVAAVPEGLPAILTFSLAVGVERLAARRAVVRRLAAVESLGCVTVIATDKTGTLTENRLVVREVDTADRAALAEAAVLANDADPHSGAGDPLDAALLAWAREEGVDPASLRSSRPRVSARAFDARQRSMGVSVRAPGGIVTFVKGAPEAVMDLCCIDGADRKRWLERAGVHAQDGLRVIAFARGDGETQAALRPVGLALLWDAPRPEAEGAVRKARGAGIRVVMITGDHPQTAAAVAAAVGIDATHVVTGAEFDAAQGEERARLAELAGVFARFVPEQKLRLVEALMAHGNVVAMTGDGVNDAPAVKRADVGVAMGLRGSDVAREVADLVLLDDHFATIVAAVEEGRRMFTNIRTFVRLLVTTNLAELTVVAVGFPLAWFLGLRDSDGSLLLPLGAAQILWVNLVTDGLPALAIAFDARPGALDRPPRRRGAPLFERSDLYLMAVCSVTVGALGLGILEFARTLGESSDAARTALLVFVCATQLALVDPIRRLAGPVLRNRVLQAATLASLALLAAAVAIPGMRRALDLEVPSAVVLCTATALVAVPWAAARAVVHLCRRAETRRTTRIA